jgi:cytoskeletal protein CcmA (bactofilin family)
VFNRSSVPPPRDHGVTPLASASIDKLMAQTPPPVPLAQTPTALSPKLSPAEKSEPGRLSIIGNDLAIMGERIVIMTKGTLQVDGEVQADLHGAEVIIGESGKVTGTICANVVDVRGTVFGTIKGAKVQLASTSTVEGDVHHQSLTVSEGAHFDGRVRRPKDLAELKPMLDPAQHKGPPPLAA